MRYATKNQIIEAAKTYGIIGDSFTNGMYTIINGDKKYFNRKLYRDSLHNLAQEGILVYNGDYTYSAK